MKRFFILLLICGSQSYAQNDRQFRKTASEISDMAREIRVSRSVRDQLEDHARLLEFAIRHEQLTPAEARKVRNQLDRIGKMLEKAHKNGKMSVSEAKALQRELSNAYRTLWFLRRNKMDKGQKIYILGQRIYLQEEYRKKVEAGSLNQKEMKDILHAYYSAHRIQELLRSEGIKPSRRASLEKECFRILSEFFTPQPPPDLPAKK